MLYVACNPGLPLVEAKRKADDAWRDTRNRENKEEVEMMLLAEASLEEKDKRLARSSFVVEKRGLEEGHRLLRGKEGGGGVKPIWNVLRLEKKNCELMRCSLTGWSMVESHQQKRNHKNKVDRKCTSIDRRWRKIVIDREGGGGDNDERGLFRGRRKIRLPLCSIS